MKVSAASTRMWLLTCMVVVGAAGLGFADDGGDDEGRFVTVLHKAVEDPDPMSDPDGPPIWEVLVQGAPAPVDPAYSGVQVDASTPSLDLAVQDIGGTSVATLVWAFDNGTDHDIAFAEWTRDAGWTDPIFLTYSLNDERDPELFVAADGSVYVTWWDATRAEVIYTRRDGLSRLWDAPVLVSTQARRPTIVALSDGVLVGYESPVQGGTEISTTLVTFSGPVRSSIATTSRTEPANTNLIALDGRLWLEWNHSSLELAYSEYVNGEWVVPETLPQFDARTTLAAPNRMDGLRQIRLP